MAEPTPLPARGAVHEPATFALSAELADAVEVAETLPAVSVVVVTYNARAFISGCLEALLAQRYPRLQVIVVDNASSDGTPDAVRRQFPSVTVVESGQNRGYGAGNNLGARLAEGEVLAFLNPDTVPEADWLLELVRCMRTHGSRWATSKIVLLADAKRLNTTGNQVHYLGLAFCRGWREPRQRYPHPELVSGCSGAAFAIQAEFFRALGGFDEAFFLYHDDVDLSLRALLAGERCLYVPTSVVAHDYDLRLSPRRWEWAEAYRHAVLLKAYRAPTLVLLAPALVAMELVTLAFLGWRGPRFLVAKLRAYGWLFSHLGRIGGARSVAQRRRRIGDRQLLSWLVDRIPYEQVARPALAGVARRILDPPLRLYRRGLLAVIRW
jgi:GT2 family glycosyltransferase